MLALAMAGAFTARAQSDMIIKQRAKDLRNANDAQVRAQDGTGQPAATPPPAAPAPAPATPPPPPSQVDNELKQNLDKLQTDLVSVGSSTSSSDAKAALQTDFGTLAKGSVRPSTTNLNKLADDLTTALSIAGSTREQGQLAQAINVIVNSSMVSAAQAQSFVVVAQTSLKTSGVPDDTIQTITADLKNILAEVQKKKPKLYQ